MSKRKRSGRPKGRRRSGSTAGERHRLRRLRLASRKKPGARSDAAWGRWTHTLPAPKRIWAPLVEQFVAARVPKRGDEACAVLLLALDNATNWWALHEGGWVGLVAGHVYVYYTGSGYREPRLYDLVEAFLLWLHEEESLPDWHLRWLRSCLDEARAAHGVATKGHERILNPAFGRQELGELNERFGEELGLDETQRAETLSIIGVLVAWLSRGGPCVRFGHLEPLAFLLKLQDELRMRDDPSGATAERAERMVLTVGSAFYRWLGESGRLDLGRAYDLSEQLFALGDVVCEDGDARGSVQ